MLSDVDIELVFDTLVSVIFVYTLLETVTLDVINISTSNYTYLIKRDETIHKVDSLLTQTDETDVDLVVSVAFLSLLRSVSSSVLNSSQRLVLRIVPLQRAVFRPRLHVWPLPKILFLLP